MKDFRDLQVWHKAHALTLEIYQHIRGFLKEESFGLTSQMRRAASSIGANIAEGCGKEGDTGLAQYMQIAMGSASELEYYLLLACDLHCLDDQAYSTLQGMAVEVKKMLASFITAIRKR
jgi:four helix bundle protein